MFLGIFVSPYCGIGATIRMGREMLCLPYAGFLFMNAVIILQSVDLTEELDSNSSFTTTSMDDLMSELMNE